MDIVDTATRSRMMAGIRGKDTKPELVVRRMAHGLGYRFRLHRRDLPGSTDLVFPSLKRVIFVHGCFWHRHAGCGLCTTPASNAAFWAAKFTRTVERDQQAIERLCADGWGVAVIWECETDDRATLKSILSQYLGR